MPDVQHDRLPWATGWTAPAGDGEVVHSEAANTPGNGVEVHAESEGSGPFAGMFPVDNEGNLLADEFRLYYKVTYAPGMKRLEGFEDYLRAKRPE